MSERLELPNGAWATLREPSAVPVRLRRPVEKCMISISRSTASEALKVEGDLTNPDTAAKIAESIGDDTLDRFNDLNDLLIVARVESWSFDTPVHLDAVLDLPAGVYEVLQAKCAERVTEMLPNFGESSDGNSPTSPSAV